MKNSSHHVVIATLLTVPALLFDASAQTAPVVFKSTCQGVGTNPQEAIGDRDGHALSVSQYSCRNDGGAEDGTVMTGTAIWEWDKTNAVSVSGNGVLRKPGTLAVYEITGGKNSLTMADGKVVGFSGTTTGVYKLATGAMAPFAGKTFRSTHKSTGAGQFVIETTID